MGTFRCKRPPPHSGQNTGPSRLKWPQFSYSSRGNVFLGTVQDCMTTGLQDCRTAVLQDYRIAELHDCRTSGLQDYRISGLQNYRTAGLQDCRVAELQDFRTAELQDYRIVKLQDCWTTRLQGCKTTGLKDYRIERLQDCRTGRQHRAVRMSNGNRSQKMEMCNDRCEKLPSCTLQMSVAAARKIAPAFTEAPRHGVLGVEIWLHGFLTSSLNKSEWSLWQ